MIYAFWKRCLDVLLSATALVISAPLQLLIAIMIRRRLGTPVLFRQERPGRGEELFVLRKFRTMLDVDEVRGLTTDAERLTPFGAFLRSTSLDELPSLWNVFRGDMSLVGPRPLLVEYLELYTQQERRRHEVRPGLTGLAQVNGRNEIAWERKFAFDLQYIDQRTLGLDLSIIWQTIGKVFRRDGINEPGSRSATPFAGHTKEEQD